jgi:hypothetical protein
MIRRALILASVVTAGGVLSGCATQPAYPLMTPIQVAQSFGYDDKPLGGTHYQVTYVTPPQAAFGYRYYTSPTQRQAKDMAFDLATLRVAQLAQQSGWQGFDITDRHSSDDTDYIDPLWGDGPWGPGWGWRHRRWWGYDGPYYGTPEERVQAEVTLSVNFTNDIKPGDYRAADVIQQVGARYPGVLAAPAAAGPAAQPTPVPQAKT